MNTHFMRKRLNHSLLSQLSVGIITLGCFFMITPMKGGSPAWVTVGPYNSRYACQDWEGSCFLSDRNYPDGYQGADGVCTGVNITKEEDGKKLYSPGNEGGSCACNDSGLPDEWIYTFYPSSGGIYKLGFGDQSSCILSLESAKKVGHPRTRKLKAMQGTFSTTCFFEGNAYE
jgi:hypothetical protein